MTNVQAAILYGQLLNIDEILDKKRIVFNTYKELLSNLENVSFQHEDENTTHSNWMFGLRFNNFKFEDKKKLELFLFESGIDVRPMFYDINKHDYLSKIKCETKNSELLQTQCLIFPSYPGLTNSQINYISSKIKKFIKQ
jgi:dTDP-4-amino-4,6-dideoxygalactose transaminase